MKLTTTSFGATARRTRLSSRIAADSVIGSKTTSAARFVRGTALTLAPFPVRFDPDNGAKSTHFSGRAGV